MTTQARELAKIVSNAGDLSFSDDITLGSDASLNEVNSTICLLTVSV